MTKASALNQTAIKATAHQPWNVQQSLSRYSTTISHSIPKSPTHGGRHPITGKPASSIGSNRSCATCLRDADPFKLLSSQEAPQAVRLLSGHANAPICLQCLCTRPVQRLQHALAFRHSTIQGQPNSFVKSISCPSLQLRQARALSICWIKLHLNPANRHCSPLEASARPRMPFVPLKLPATCRLLPCPLPLSNLH